MTGISYLTWQPGQTLGPFRLLMLSLLNACISRAPNFSLAWRSVLVSVIQTVEIWLLARILDLQLQVLVILHALSFRLT